MNNSINSLVMNWKELDPNSTLAWKIPWMEEPGRLQSMGLLRVRHAERLHFHFSLSCIGEGNGNPLQYSCLENPRNGGASWAAIYGVAQSQTRLKQLSSSSSRKALYLNSLFQSLFLFLKNCALRELFHPPKESMLSELSPQLSLNSPIRLSGKFVISWVSLTAAKLWRHGWTRVRAPCYSCFI